MRLLRWAARLALQTLGGACAACLYLLRPFLLVRFARLRTERIGHLALNTELHLRRLALDGAPARTRWVFIGGEPCNRQLFEMFRRELRRRGAFVAESPALAKLVDVLRPVLERTPFYDPLPCRSNEYRELNEARSSLSFTPEEDARGRRGLERMGIGPRDWFVCFHDRSSDYLKGRAPARDWSYHDFRDTSIENFVPAARYVAEQGGFAVRVGASAGRPLPAVARHPRVLDYAREFRDDFMDIYLLARCRFMIASDAGLAQVATAFDVPVVNTNVPCLDWASFRSPDLFIHKKFRDERSGAVLSFRRILDRGIERLLRGELLAAQGVRLVENTPEEILGAAREMHERLEGRHRADPEDEALQDAYRALFEPRHVCFGYRSRAGAEYLRANRGALELRRTA